MTHDIGFSGVRGSPRWRPVAASRTGARHLARAADNQDAYAVEVTSGHQVVVVADGHGAESHPRSAAGARLAADVAAAVLLEVAGQQHGRTTDFEADLASRAAPQLVDRWRAAVLQHAAANTWTDQEAAAIGGRTTDPSAVLYAYGTTVLGLVATAGLLGVIQLGDGDVVLALADGTARRPLPDDPALVGSQTSSLAQDDPLASMRVAAVDLRAVPVLLAWASTDGFGAGRADAHGWWLAVARELIGHVRTHGVSYLAEKLPIWLEEPAEVGGDDTTIAMLVDSDELPSPGRTWPRNQPVSAG